MPTAEGFLILQPTAVRNWIPMHDTGVAKKNPESFAKCGTPGKEGLTTLNEQGAGYSF